MRAPRRTVTTPVGVVAAALLVASAGAAPSAANPSPRPVPLSAPAPTDTGKSPAAPDPHPPRGGLGPGGAAVGGNRLLGRRLVLPSGAPALPGDLTARAWVVADLDTGEIVAARDPHGRYQPASIQKILTTVTLLPLLPGARTVTVSRRAADTEGSHAGLVAGGRYTVDQLFEGLLLVSGNDAAEALAEAAGGRRATVARMNRTALHLGAYDTYIQTPSGLDGWQQLTSAYDMTLFLRAALAQPRFVAYDTPMKITLPRQRIAHQGRVNLWNQNEEFLTTVRGAVVAKTGYTDAAQHTFAGVIRRGGHSYGVVFLRAQRYPDDQWVQATKLVRWAASLPPGTPAVGSLESAPTPATTARAPAGPDATRSAGSGPAPHTRQAARSSAGISSATAGLAGLGLLAVLAGGYLARRRFA